MDISVKQIQRDTVVNISQKQQKSELKLMGSIKPKNGHTLFKVDKKTLKVSKANFEGIDVHFDNAKTRDTFKRKKVIIEQGFIYVSSLNEKNVLKRLKRLNIF